MCRDQISEKEDPFGPIDPLSCLPRESNERYCLYDARDDVERAIAEIELRSPVRAIAYLLRAINRLRRLRELERW
jgi:hypothetical protein